MGNNLTYFLDYMGTMMIRHLDAYVFQHRFLMPVTTQGYFTWKDYQSSRPVEDSQSKQYLLRLLQRLVLLEFLTVIEVSKQKLFKLHPMK